MAYHPSPHPLPCILDLLSPILPYSSPSTHPFHPAPANPGPSSYPLHSLITHPLHPSTEPNTHSSSAYSSTCSSMPIVLTARRPHAPPSTMPRPVPAHIPSTHPRLHCLTLHLLMATCPCPPCHPAAPPVRPASWRPSIYARHHTTLITTSMLSQLSCGEGSGEDLVSRFEGLWVWSQPLSGAKPGSHHEHGPSPSFRGRVGGTGGLCAGLAETSCLPNSLPGAATRASLLTQRG